MLERHGVSAAVLITGVPGAGKSTLGAALVDRLRREDSRDAVFIDEHDGGTKARALWRMVWSARTEMRRERVAVIAVTAPRKASRRRMHRRLKPLIEVHLVCDEAVARSRAYDGRSHVDYEPGSPDVVIDTGTRSIDEATEALVERVRAFLDAQQMPRPSGLRGWFDNTRMRFLVDFLPGWVVEVPWLRHKLLREAQAKKAVVHLERPRCAQLFVMFGGLDVVNGTDGSFLGRQVDFLRASGLFQRNLMYVRDPYLANYERGVSDEVPTLPALAESINAYASTLPQVREVHALGYSSGSYGALAAGHHARIKSVWAFSPRTVRPRGNKEAIRRLRDLLSQHNGVTEYHILFAAQNRRDRAFSKMFAGCPGVTLHPFEEAGNTHLLFNYLVENKMLPEILPPFLAAEGTAAGRVPLQPR